MKKAIEADEVLLREALEVTGLESEDQVVEEVLRTLLRLGYQRRLRASGGKLPWGHDEGEVRSEK